MTALGGTLMRHPNIRADQSGSNEILAIRLTVEAKSQASPLITAFCVKVFPTGTARNNPNRVVGIQPYLRVESLCPPSLHKSLILWLLGGILYI
jgi:hypothetical protein